MRLPYKYSLIVAPIHKTFLFFGLLRKDSISNQILFYSNKKMKLQFTLIAVALCLFTSNVTFAQSERSLVRKGNIQYQEGKFSDAEVNYRKSINENPEDDLEESVFNLGNALYKQDRFEEAASRFERAAEMAATREERAQAFHNLGNSLLKNSKLKESIEAYKNALRNNSKDSDTRYNLALAQEMLKQQQEQEQQQDQEQQQQNENENQDENQNEKEQQEQNENENQDENENQEDKKEENEQQSDSEEQKEEEQNQQQQQQKEEEQEGGEQQNQQQSPEQQETRELTKEEAARLLEALKNEELKVQQKLNRQKGKVNRVRIEKDW